METIYKYELEATTNINLPESAEILTVQMQHEKPCMWVRLDSQKPGKQRTFHMVGTGHSLESFSEVILDYVGTIQMYGGELVFHIFEEKYK